MCNTQNSMRSRISIGLLVVTLGLALSQVAVSEPARLQTLQPSKAVSLKGLDLTNDRDLQTLHARVRAAAILVCQDLMLTGVPGWTSADKKCIRDTYSSSIDLISQAVAARDPATADRLVAGKLFAASTAK